MGKNIHAWLSQGMVHAVDIFEQTYAPFLENLRPRYLKNDPAAMCAVNACNVFKLRGKQYERK